MGFGVWGLGFRVWKRVYIGLTGLIVGSLFKVYGFRFTRVEGPG